MSGQSRAQPQLTILPVLTFLKCVGINGIDWIRFDGIPPATASLVRSWVRNTVLCSNAISLDSQISPRRNTARHQDSGR